MNSVRCLPLVLLLGLACVAPATTQDCPYEDGEIDNISGNSLPPGLVTFFSHANPLAYISDDAFVTSATTLRKIVIINATRFHTFPRALSVLTAIEEVNILKTPIRDYSMAAIQGISYSLTTLSLEIVNLTYFPGWSFYFIELRTLDLTSNCLGEIPSFGFNAFMFTLSTLILRNTCLTQAPYGLRHFTNLTKLNLSYNNLTNANVRQTVTTLESSASDTLNYLDLSYVGLIGCPNFSNFSRLDRLILSGNRISNVSEGLLPLSLTELILGMSNLTSVPSVSALPNLTSLQIPYNLIERIGPNSFPPSITAINLSNNRLIYVTNQMFANLVHLGVLFLNNNPIIAIDPSAFSDLVSLGGLYLLSTHLIEVPVGLASVAPHTRVEISTVYPWFCECPPDASLAQWYTSPSGHNGSAMRYVFGDCDNTQSAFSFLRGQCTV